MTLFLVRHGQSLANKLTDSCHRNLEQVADESPLSVLGQTQAHSLGKLLSTSTGLTNSPLILSSPMSRAWHTATILQEHLPNSHILVHQGLQEVAIADKSIVAGVKAARVELAGLISEVKTNFRNLRIVVAHEWILQLFLQELLGCNNGDVWFRLANCSVTKFMVDRCVRSDGCIREGLSLVSLSDVSHLKSDQITY